MSEQASSQELTASKSDRVIKDIDFAIVGGGVAGLYCALRLGQTYSEQPTIQGDRSADYKSILVFEGSPRFGGRIYTQRVSAQMEQQKEEDFSKLEFYAEFGPMRIEPEQELLRDLVIKRLNIQETTDGHENEAHLVDFPAYASPASEQEPHYALIGAENDQKTPLDLMMLAFARILGQLTVSIEKGGTVGLKEKEYLRSCLREGKDALLLASSPVLATPFHWRAALQSWIGDLQESDYQNIREYAEFDDVPLYQMGFWNLLSEVLSHDAVMKLRDLGTFYHLIPDNPNAAEWLIFWLRNIKASEHLQGIFGGMTCITERLLQQLNKMPQIGLMKNHKLVSIQPEDDRVRLGFEGEPETAQPQSYRAKHVILALPKAPLKKVAFGNERYFPKHVADDLESVFGFPMVKVFVIVKKRWWEEEYRANRYATRIPTRELHYWKSNLKNSTKGMIMIYTDRPASAFWANYVTVPGRQDEPEWKNEESWRRDGHKNRRLIKKVLQYLIDNGVENIREDDIESYGIRDWGREPYVGANHAWRPERKSWEVLTALSSFSLCGSTAPNVHICGEAYSDYHGFIEGSLRSSVHVLHTIDERFDTKTPWLCRCTKCAGDKSRAPQSTATFRTPQKIA